MHAYSTEGVIAPPQDSAATIEFISCGPAIPCTTIRILDAEGRDLPDRRVGQIVLTSPYLFSGYYRMATPEGKLEDGWYRTGDLGFTDQGEIFVCGRADDLLIIHGKNIYAHDVEYSVNRYTPVKPGRCVAIGPYNPKVGSQSLVVIAETEDPSPEARTALVRAVKSVIEAEFSVTVYDVHVESPGWMMKTTSGKISRGGNLEKYLSVKPM
jgi:acyl-CoA synthetase (AMP-forming)/AMP-acid ligase II